MSKRQEFLSGIKETLPLILGAIPFGIIFGAFATAQAGLTTAETMAMSLLVFAGSAQFIAVGLIAQGTGAAVIVLTTFIVNLRHALYSASLAPYLQHLSQRWLLPLAFWLTDETYAVTIRRYQGPGGKVPMRHWYMLGSAVSMYLNWQLCTFIGAVAGQSLGDATSLGLDFAMTVTFIGIVIPLLVDRPMVAAAVVAGIVALLADGLPNNLGLMLASGAGIGTGMLFDWSRSDVARRLRKRGEFSA